MNNAITIYTGQTLTVAPEIGAGAVCVDCSADTNLNASIQIKLTNGTANPGQGRTITIYYAFINDSLTNNINTSAYKAAESFNITCDANDSSVVYYKQDTLKRGKYLCMWYDHRVLSNTVTLAASLLY